MDGKSTNAGKDTVGLVVALEVAGWEGRVTVGVVAAIRPLLPTVEAEVIPLLHHSAEVLLPLSVGVVVLRPSAVDTQTRENIDSSVTYSRSCTMCKPVRCNLFV